MRYDTEKKKRGVQRFFKLSVDRHKREVTPDTPAQTVKGRKGKKKWVKPLVILLIIGAAAAAAMIFRDMKAEIATTQAQLHSTTSAERRDISSELSSLRILRAKGIYSITSIMEGEMLSVGFEEGDQMERDQMLYEIDRSSMESQLTSSVNSLSGSQSSYEDALEDHNDALGGHSRNTYKATDTEYVKEPYISTRDKASGSTKLADVYDDDVMEIRTPSLSGEAVMIRVGMPVTVIPTDTGGQVAGTVKVAANQETVLTGGRLVRVITIQMQNPGGLTIPLRTAVQVGEFIGSEDRAFETSVDATVNTDLPTSVEVESLLVNAGDYVTRGTLVFKMTDKPADKLIQSYKDVLDKVEESAESTQNKLDSIQDSYDNYTIRAPISGQVITKNFGVGDNITKNSSGATVLATIYGLFSLIFEMSIDELNIKEARVGQEIEVSADTLEGQTFSGIATNVSLEGTYSNSVSTYPVTVTLDDMGDLLPGMNVDGIITLKKASDVLAIPVDTPVGGNRVYMKNDTATEQQGPAPAGFRSVKAKTGLASDAYVEITSGLSEGDVVYVAESGKSSSSFMMMTDRGVGGPPGGGGSMGGRNRGGSGGHQDR